MKKFALLAVLAALVFSGSGCLWPIYVDDDMGDRHGHHHRGGGHGGRHHGGGHGRHH